ncbi:hypothetical protein FB45DRAFT_891463, partial [Roridomyces roridus]
MAVVLLAVSLFDRFGVEVHVATLASGAKSRVQDYKIALLVMRDSCSPASGTDRELWDITFYSLFFVSSVNVSWGFVLSVNLRFEVVGCL